MKKRTSVRRRAFRLENLEQRTVLSTAAVVDGVLHIDGDSGDNFIHVAANELGQITVDFDPAPENEPQAFDPEELEITAIEIDGGRGGDQITVDLAEWGVLAGDSLAVRVEGGQGADAASVNLLEFAADGELSVEVDLGQGNDEAANIDLSSLAVSADGVVNVNVEGGQGTDAASVLIDGAVVDGTLNVALDGGIGADDLSVALTGSEINGGESVHVTLEGRTGDDALSLDLSGSIVNEGAVLTANVESGPGVNETNLAFVEAMIAGNLDVNVQGGPSEDAVMLDLAGSQVLPGSVAALNVDSGPGGDAWNIALGEVLLEGLLEADFGAGTGDDTLTVEGAGGQIAAGGAVNIGGQGGPGADLLDDETLDLVVDEGGALNVDLPLGPEETPPEETPPEETPV